MNASVIPAAGSFEMFEHLFPADKLNRLISRRLTRYEEETYLPNDDTAIGNCVQNCEVLAAYFEGQMGHHPQYL